MEKQAQTGEFGIGAKMSIQDESAPDRIGDAKIQVKAMDQ